LINELQRGSATHGGCPLIAQAHGILGIIQFLEGPYLVLVAEKRRCGDICGHVVYGVASVSLLQIHSTECSAADRASIKQPVLWASNPTGSAWSSFLQIVRPQQQRGEIAAAERRYRKLIRSLDLTRDFFFSNTYSLSRPLQANVKSRSKDSVTHIESIFVWNSHLKESFQSILGNDVAQMWTVSLIHGFFQQVHLSSYGQRFSITLLARRSSKFAGTRYRKRGISNAGFVANEVETEQIVTVCQQTSKDVPLVSSCVQVRGSIPLFWSQDMKSMSPKPEIVVQRVDPLYQATQTHYEHLVMRYASPIITLSLIKVFEKIPRETNLQREFYTALNFLRQSAHSHLNFLQWDFSQQVKKKGTDALHELVELCNKVLHTTGIFVSSVTSGNFVCQKMARHSDMFAYGNKRYVADSLFQNGVLRTNCIDCLDRTNVAQYAYGLCALNTQLYYLNLIDGPEVPLECDLANMLMDLYQSMGDVIALQYGGSEAHAPILSTSRGHSRVATQTKEALVSVKRYYNNTYNDDEKQEAINLFLGNFIPSKTKPHLWDLNSDHYLHGRVNNLDLSRRGQQQDQASNTCTSLGSLCSGFALEQLKHPFKYTSQLMKELWSKDAYYDAQQQNTVNRTNCAPCDSAVCKAHSLEQLSGSEFEVYKQIKLYLNPHNFALVPKHAWVWRFWCNASREQALHQEYVVQLPVYSELCGIKRESVFSNPRSNKHNVIKIIHDTHKLTVGKAQTKLLAIVDHKQEKAAQLGKSGEQLSNLSIVWSCMASNTVECALQYQCKLHASNNLFTNLHTRLTEHILSL